MARIDWLEISADYRCNNRCVGCFSVQEEGPSMSSEEAAATLLRGRRLGARFLWLGGGDPTMRADLFGIVRAARRLGYERIKIQTNGMRLADPAYATRLVEAGVTEVSFSIKGANAETHDRLTRTPGCHALLLRGIAEMRAREVPMEGDLLVYRSNQAELPAMVRVYHGLGLARFNVWLLSAVDAGAPDVDAEVPRISEVMPHLVAAMAQRLSDRPDFVTSLHTPPCTVPSRHHACLFHAASLHMLVANPGGHAFRLEESPIEGGLYLDRCASCAARPRCGGIRADYVRIHGDSEFQPIPL